MTSKTWRCHACQTFNETGRRTCQVCEEARAEEASVASPRGPTWRCHACHTFNPGTVLACELCDMARDATANIPRPTPKKNTAEPRRPEPRSTPKAKTAHTAKAKGTKSPPKRPSEKASTSSLDGEIFFPPVGTTPPPAPSAPPMPTPPPSAPPGGWSRPGHTVPPAPKARIGCGPWIAIAIGLFVLLGLGRGCLSFLASFAGPDHSYTYEGSEPDEERCPSRVADLIPASGRSTLVEAFETDRHRIILCSDTNGEIYYHGETLDSEEEGILMEAEATSDGYVAWNDPYAYEITGDEVVVSNDSGEIGRYTLYPWEDPV